MRYRLMASYLGASYQAAVGPTDGDVTLFAAPPPPEEHGFSPASGGIWRKFVRVDELDALWESRPIGSYHGEPCLVLDDLGDRLHIVYLGTDERRAGQLGYWQVDRGVFEVVVARHEVTDLVEERHEFPIGLLLSALPRALSAGGTGAGGPGSAAGAGHSGQQAGGQAAAWNGQPVTGSYQGTAAGPQQAPSGLRQLAAAGPQQPVTGSYQGQAAAQQVSQQPLPPSGGLAGMPSAVPGSPGRPPFPGSSPGQVPVPQLPGAAQASLPSGQMSSAQVPSVQVPGGVQPGSQQAFAAPPGLAQPGQPGQARLPQAQQYQAAVPLPAALPSAQPPTAVAAWHGSPAADGNGTWYYQPADTDSQQNGFAPNGYPQNGYPQNGFSPNGFSPNGYPQNGTFPNGAQGYAQPGQGLGYQQAPAPQQVAPAQPGVMQPTQQPQQLSPFGQQAQAPVMTEQQPVAAPPAPSAAQPNGVVQFPPAGAATFAVQTPPVPSLPPVPAVPPGPPAPAQAPPSQTGPMQAAPAQAAPAQAWPAMTISTLSAPLMAAPAGPADLITTGPLPPAPQADQAPQGAPAPTAGQADQAPAAGPTAGGALSKLTGAVRGRRAARKPRLAMSAIFADLVDLAHIPRSAYAVDDEVTGAMCLFKTDGGYEVFSCAEDARHEVRFFEEEEAAYFYLFGVLAAEALRNGRLSPRRG